MIEFLVNNWFNITTILIAAMAIAMSISANRKADKSNSIAERALEISKFNYSKEVMPTLTAKVGTVLPNVANEYVNVLFNICNKSMGPAEVSTIEISGV